MKKQILTIMLIGSITCANAQDAGDSIPKNKKGYEILPAPGDIGLGFNTIPVLDMLLGSFRPVYTGAGDLVQYAQGSNNQIVGKYFLDRKTAIRVRFGFNTLSGSVTNRVQDAEAMAAASLGTADDIAAASLVRVEDRLSYRKSNIMLSVGLEKRRGYRRLQGFYGAELGFSQQGARQDINYGNAFSDQHRTYYTDFSSGSVTTASVNPNTPGRSTRELERRYTGGFTIGLRGFIGIEYFIFSKISLAAEYGWGYAISTRRNVTSKREVFNNGQGGASVFQESVNADSNASQNGFAVDNNNGSVFSLDNTVVGNTALSGGAGALTLIFHF